MRILRRLALAVLMLCAATSGVLADDGELSVSLVLLEETYACQPEGYAGPDMAEPDSDCYIWQATDAVDLIAEAHASARMTMAPEESPMELGDLGPAVRRYARNCNLKQPCGDAHERSSILLVFEWAEAQTGKLTLTRSPVANIPETVWTYEMSNERIWVNHQRADLFFPPYETTWTLSLGDRKWQLTMR